MKVKIELKRLNGVVIFSYECEDNNVAKTIDAFRASRVKFDLNGVNLRNADLSGADLSGTDLSSVNFRFADFRSADLSWVNFRNADLRGADFRDANLSRTNFSNANLSRTNFRNADLRGADLSGADLRYANLKDSDLSEVDVSVMTAFLLPQCPSEGSFVAWKEASGMIVKLLVTEDAKRSSATTLICRCSKAKVLAIENMDGSESELKEIESSQGSDFVYRVGETVEVKDFDDNRWNECSTGIYFFIAREMAVNH